MVDPWPRDTWSFKILYYTKCFHFQLDDGLQLYLATVQSLDEKGIAKKMGLKEHDQILEVCFYSSIMCLSLFFISLRVGICGESREYEFQ